MSLCPGESFCFAYKSPQSCTSYFRLRERAEECKGGRKRPEMVKIHPHESAAPALHSPVPPPNPTQKITLSSPSHPAPPITWLPPSLTSCQRIESALSAYQAASGYTGGLAPHVSRSDIPLTSFLLPPMEHASPGGGMEERTGHFKITGISCEIVAVIL